MRSTTINNFNRITSRSRRNSNHPYSSLSLGGPSEDSDDIDGIPPYFLKILGPLAPRLLSDDYHDPEELQRRLRFFSLSLLGTSVFFWIWALHNTRQLRSSGGFDLGVVSFFGSGLSSSLLLRSSSGGRCCNKEAREREPLDVYGARQEPRRGTSSDHVPPGKCLRAFAALTQLTVVANYLMGLLFAFTASESRVYVYFATYCFAFSLLWTAVAFSGWLLVTAYMAAVIRAYGEDIANRRSRTCLGVCLAAWMILTNQSIGNGGEVDNCDYGHKEEEEIDDELRSLYEGYDDYTSA